MAMYHLCDLKKNLDFPSGIPVKKFGLFMYFYGYLFSKKLEIAASKVMGQNFPIKQDLPVSDA